MESAELAQHTGAFTAARRGRAGESAAVVRRLRLRDATLPAVGLVVALVTALLAGRSFVNGDSVWALAWGDQLFHGELDSFKFGPTPHPSTIALGALTSPLGFDASYAIMYAVFGPLALGGLAAAMFELARRVSGSILGAVVAVALLLTSPMVLDWSAGARYDVMFAALVLGAMSMRLARPGTSLAPLGLLAVAGLIRPEAWVLSGLLWLWQMRELSGSRRAVALGLAGLAPAIWALMDFAVTGDPLYSLHVTDTYSQRLYGQYAPLENLSEGGRNLLVAVGALALIVAPIGLAVGLRRCRPATTLVAGVLAIATVIFLVLVTKGLASSERYLLLPACLLMVLAAAACVPHGARRHLVVASLALLIVQVAGRADAPLEAGDNVRMASERDRAMTALVEREGVRSMIQRCPTVAVPTSRMLGQLVRQSRRPASRWTVDARARSRPDVFVAPASHNAVDAVLTRRRFDSDPTFSVPAGMVPGPATNHWRIYVAEGATCAT